MRSAPRMPKQPSFPSVTQAMKKTRTRREQFLSEMDMVVPWSPDFWRSSSRITNRIIAMVRAKVKRPFWVIERQLG